MSNDSMKLLCSEIDRAIRSFPWMDFEFTDLSFVRAIVTGYLDTSSERYELELRFSDVAFAAAKTSWSTDTARPVFSLATAEDDIQLRRRFGVEAHQHIFCIRPEVGDSPYYVGAAEVELVILPASGVAG